MDYECNLHYSKILTIIIIKNSAVSVTTKEKQFEICKLLMEKNVAFGPDEDTKGISIDLLTEKYIQDLLASSTIVQNYKKHFEKELLGPIKKIYKEIGSTEIGALLLQIVATNKYVKICFEFTRDLVKVINPTQNLFIYHICNKYSVGAKGLFVETKRNEVKATLKYELYLLALQFIFRNNSKPYAVDYYQHMLEFDKITKYCEELKDLERIISCVFDCYPKEFQHAELIVRFPYQMEFYRNNRSQLNEIKELYQCLYEYFYEIVVPALKESLKILEKFPEESNELSLKN
ncbi:hypothetical protein PVAND_003103 [Polypedilum vanderplanki]|uniref:Uncharacterized protein n=1 Tax=Polypedilum vanderplanki TaxID=319348 RepID=A0A9J6BT09_POLVA|nr:hypothetical protein PVAND_003103 [Polypedilum vanderplanki]